VADLVVPGEKEPGVDGSILRVTPESAGWEYVGFEVVRLDAGRTPERDTGSEEVCLVVLSGRGDVFAEQDEWRGVGERESPFEGLPYAVYLPPATEYCVEVTADLELAVASAPAGRGVEPRLIRPEDVQVGTRGSGTYEREVRDTLMEGSPQRDCSSSRSSPLKATGPATLRTSMIGTTARTKPTWRRPTTTG
jgi:5-deoxy-glucuronate isomerase